MINNKLFLYFLLSINFICYGQKSNPKTDISLTEKDKDSISNIVNKLYGNWILNQEKFRNLNQKGIYNCHMTISKCLILKSLDEKDDNQFENEICIEEIIPIIETPVGSPKPNFKKFKYLIEEYYFPASFRVKILKKENEYGLFFADNDPTEFVRIKSIDDKLLTLKDGRQFIKIR